MYVPLLEHTEQICFIYIHWMQRELTTNMHQYICISLTLFLVLLQ